MVAVAGARPTRGATGRRGRAEEAHARRTAGRQRAASAAGQGQTYGQVTERDGCSGSARRSEWIADGSRVFHSAEAARQHDRRVVRHVPPARRQHAPRDLSEVPGAARTRRAAARHDQLVHRAPGAGKPLAGTIPTMRALEAYILAQRKGKRSTTASTDRRRTTRDCRQADPGRPKGGVPQRASGLASANGPPRASSLFSSWICPAW